MFPPDNPTSQPIILACWYWSNGWHQARIEEANAATQTAQVTPRGSLATLTIEFKYMRNVSLQYGFSGIVLESFGSPRTATPWLLESLPASAYGEIS
jgi:hypothetical protein